jgi:hypothetical protein
MKTQLSKPARHKARYTEEKPSYHRIQATIEPRLSNNYAALAQRLRRRTFEDKKEAARLLSKCQKT